MVEEPIRAIEQPINLARHDEVVLMQSFDLLGAQRDSRTTPAEVDVMVTGPLAIVPLLVRPEARLLHNRNDKCLDGRQDDAQPECDG